MSVKSIPVECAMCNREKRRLSKNQNNNQSLTKIADKKCSCPDYETIKNREKTEQIYKCNRIVEKKYYNYTCDPKVFNANQCAFYPTCQCVVQKKSKFYQTKLESYRIICSCPEKRPRSSTISTCDNLDRKTYTTANFESIYSSANRIDDFNKIYTNAIKTCQCKINADKNVCRCKTCLTQRSKYEQKMKMCSCRVRREPIAIKNSDENPPYDNIKIKQNADETDSKNTAFRNAAIAENVLEYEISALEHGISLLSKLNLDEPKYENVDEINKKYGDRIEPDGQNLEDEVQYENVSSNWNLNGSREQKAAASRILSASANNLYPVKDFKCCKCLECASADFYANNRSGTFPQYLQKEVKELGLARFNGIQHPAGGSSKTVVEYAKKEMFEVKQQRLLLAQDEYKHLSSALTALAASRTSLCSSGSGGSARYDPELLRSDVKLSRGRVAQLRKELQQVRAELSCTQQGVDTLHSVEQKISSQQGCYNITEAQAIVTELKNIQKSLNSGEKEKAELMQSLAKLKDDLTRLQLGDVSPEISTLSLPQEKLSTASQTDLCSDLPIGTRLAEITRMRLQYDESRKKIQQIQQQLADLEDKVQPGQAESDKDRLLLFQEKKQLLMELRSITPRTRSKQEMSDIQSECKKLEQDLHNCLEMSNRCIVNRLKLHEEKKLLVQQLRDALRSMTTLESQLKNLSASTLSVSSSSSLGSLSTTSSKGSLSSGLSFTDIYGGPQCITAPSPLDKPIDMVDLHRRVERLLRGSSSGSGLAAGSGSQPSLSPRSSLSSVSPPMSPPTAPPPSYDLLSLNPQHLDGNHLEERLAELKAAADGTLYMSSGKLDAIFEELKISDVRQELPLSPISETPPPLIIDQEELLQSTSGALSGTPTSSGTNSRSVSAAVSDESVAGDSGVFEASCRLRESTLSAPIESATAQIQIKLQYSQEEQTLYVGVQKIRNLHLITLKDDESIYIRALILPAVREAGAPLPVPLRLPLPLPAPALRAQTLRLQACRRQHCLGLVQVSLADFACDSVSIKWYNVLSLQGNDKEEMDAMALSCREESSDESTLISSQTSTLTRNQSNDGSSIPIAVESPRSSDDEEDEDEENEEEESLLRLNSRGSYHPSIHQILEEEYYLDVVDPSEDGSQSIDPAQEIPIPLACTMEKETNTECNFNPDGGRRRISALLPCDDRLSIKRSQTFSPTPQLAKNQYICRLNRSESDSSMPLYRRGTGGGASFDRHAVVRRSLRRGRTSGLPGSSIPGRTSSTHSSHAPRTSLDLELDLRAQHHKLDTLQQEIAGLRVLKQRLEVARENGDSTVANWATEDEAFVQLCEEGMGSSSLSSTGLGTSAIATERAERRAARALQKTCRDIYRLRRTRTPRGKPDLITFKEKMAFFTRYHPNVPALPSDEDVLEHSADTYQESEQISQISQILGVLDCETRDSIDFSSDLPDDVNQRLTSEDLLDDKDNTNDSDITDMCGGLSDIQVGYQVRRSGRCKNVVKKSQMLENLDLYENISGQFSSENLDVGAADNSKCLRLLTERGNNLLSNDGDGLFEASQNDDKNVVKTSDKDNGDVNGARYQYVVDRDLGVQV